MKDIKLKYILFFSIALSLFAFSSRLHAQSLTLGPYLQNVTDNSIVVKFELDTAAEVQVHYGLTDSYGNVVNLPASTIFEITLDGLSTGEFYHYRLFTDSRPLSGDNTFRVAPPPRASFRLLIMGDTRSDHDAHRSIVSAASETHAHVWVHTGDMVSSGEVLDQWYSFFDIETLIMKNVPQFGTIGNHDEDSGNADNYLRFYSLPQNSLAPEYYYSFDYGNLHGIVLDGHVQVDPEWVCILRIGGWDECFNEQQLEWLNDDLEGAARNPDIDHILVFTHIGPYSSKEGRTGSTQMRDLLPTFRDHGVDMIISGHDHYYERGFSNNAIPYVISAGGGAPLYEIITPPPIPAHTVEFNETAYHYTVVDIDWLCVTLTAYRLDGSILDTYGYCSDPKVCVVPEMDCGALPPSCSDGRWVCEAGFCAVQDCEGVEPVPDDVVEPTPEEIEETDIESEIEPAADQQVPEDGDASAEVLIPDGEEDPGTDDADQDGQTGCSCSTVI